VLNYQSYPKNKTGYPFFWNILYIHQYLQPDDERPAEVSVSVVRVIEPVEHVCSRAHVHVPPELRTFSVATTIRRSADHPI